MHLKYYTLLLAGVLGIQAMLAQPSIIPMPREYKAVKDSFLLNNKVALVVSDAGFADEGYYLQKQILKLTGVTIVRQEQKKAPFIALERLNLKNAVKGSYTLKMSAAEITISATDDEGVFNGISSFLQLAASAKTIKNVHPTSLKLASWEIKDEPLYGWRGLMLDESRHFFGKEKVKSLLDWMAFYKLNKFHWHLTDEPGWRLEIKKYPLLTLVGGIGSYTDPNTPTAYYTQQEIKEVINYAAERKIEVIPEIDMPGHARAANKAYPEFSGGGSEKYPDFTFDPGNEKTYQYLTDILKEVNVLFPSQKIHLGGDEVSFGNQQWNKNPGIKRIMEAHQLKDLKEVEDYFMKRMADSLYQLNSKFLAWDEMANLSLPPDKTIIFWWRHDQPKQLQIALDKNYEVVLCPRIPFYFDFVQDNNHTVGRKWQTAYTDLKTLYDFKTDGLVTKNKQKQVLGVQANIWAETIVTPQRLDYMTYPRISALAEVAWSDKKDYDNYLQRLKTHLAFYEKDGIYYYNPFQPAYNSEPRK